MEELGERNGKRDKDNNRKRIEDEGNREWKGEKEKEEKVP